MIDWFVFLSPVALLLVLPFLFMGCGLEAVGVMPDNAFLHFGTALVSQNDPNAVEPRPIHQITVQWTFRGSYILVAPKKPTKFLGPYTEQVPPQTKGSADAPLPPLLSEDFFKAQIIEPNGVHLSTISCRCAVTLDQGEIVNIQEVLLPYTQGSPHMFRLVRGVKTPNTPGASKKFSVQAETM